MESEIISYGAVVAEHATLLNDFCLHFGKSLFSIKQIPDRIDFLYDTVQAQKDIMSSVLVELHEEIICLTDQQGDFKHLSIAIMNETEEGAVYSIREFAINPSTIIGSTELTEDGSTYYNALNDPSPHWNFTNENGKVKIFAPSDAFLNPYKTRTVTNMIVWASNILGFVQKSH